MSLLLAQIIFSSLIGIINALALIIFIHFCFLFHLLSTVASGLNALAAVTVEDFAPLVVQHIATERETLVSKLLGM